MTLIEIGQRLGLSRERVRQIEGAALAHMRDMTFKRHRSTSQFGTAS